MKQADDLLRELENLEFDPKNFKRNLSDILDSILCEFKGPTGFAKEVVLLYRTPKIPGSTKAGILTALLRLLEKSDAYNNSDEIPAEFQTAFAKLAEQMEKRGNGHGH
jgi:hypothetical protein